MPVILTPPVATITTCAGQVVVDITGTPGPWSISLPNPSIGAVVPVTTSQFIYASVAFQNGIDTITVTDVNTLETATFTITVSGCPPLPLQIVSSIGQFTYLDCGDSVRLTAINGTPTYTWAVGTLGAYGTVVVSGVNGEFLDFTATTPINAAAFFAIVSASDSGGQTIQSFIGLRCNLPFSHVDINVPSVCGFDTMITATGGVGPYTFAASASPTVTFAQAVVGPTITLSAITGSGAIFVTITDSIGNVQLISVPVACAPGPLFATLDPNAALNCGTTAQVFPSGGTLPYTFATQGCPAGVTVSAGGLVSVALGTPSNVCAVVVTDGAGDTFTVPIVWTCEPIPPLAPLEPVQDALCGTDVLLGIEGGSPVYTWSSAPALAGTLTVAPDGLSATLAVAPTFVGAVTVSVSDSSIPVQTVVMVINVTCPPTPLVVDQPSVRIDCGDTFTVTVSGGTAPYTWTSNCGLNVTIAPLVGPTITGTAIPGFAGSCQLTVTDAAGQTRIVGVTVLCDNDRPRIVAGGGILLCNETRTLFVQGGTAPYTWSAPCPALLTLGAPGPLGASIPVTSNNTNGTCTVTVTDANGLTDTAQLTVVCNPATLIATHYCVGCGGTVQINVGGGALPLTYAVASDDCGGQCPPGSAVSATGLFTAAAESGACFVRVTDADGNVLYIPVIIVCPPVIVLPPLFPDFVIPPLLTMAPKPATVECNTTLQFVVTGGVAPYVFSLRGCTNLWGEPLGTISATGLFTATNYVTGRCFVEVTDSRGRKAVSSIRVTCSPPCNDCVNCPPIPPTP